MFGWWRCCFGAVAFNNMGPVRCKRLRCVARDKQPQLLLHTLALWFARLQQTANGCTTDGMYSAMLARYMFNTRAL